MTVSHVMTRLILCLFPFISKSAYANMDGLHQQIKASGVSRFPSPTDIYPEVKDDLTKVNWAHAVNDKKRLQGALRGKAMMLEADVTQGKLASNLNSASPVLIMAHPPITVSDLSLDDFLDTVLDYPKPKGIKLDIKSIDVLDDCLKAIEKRINRIRIPLWINADILLGPHNAASQPVNPYAFIYAVKERIPQASLSVGWTTKVDKTALIHHGYYTRDQVSQMRDVIVQANLAQPITFPVRGALLTAQESYTNLVWLLNEIPGSTLTVWSAYGDVVDVKGLVDFMDSVGRHRVYIDVPPRLDCKIARLRAIHSVTSYFSSWFG